MFNLDNRTILVCLLVVGVFTSTFSFIPSKKYKIEELKGFRLANISYILGFGTLLFQGVLPSIITVIVANSLILLCFIIFTQIILLLFNISQGIKFSVAIFVINLFLFIIFLYIYPSTYIRIVIISSVVSLILIRGVFLFLKYLRRKRVILLSVLVVTLCFYILMSLLRVLLTTQLHLNIDSIFSLDLATTLIFLSTISYHLAVNFVIFIRLLNISEIKLESKIKLIKETHSDMKDINSLIIESDKHTLNAEFYNRVSSFIRKRFNVTSIVIYKLNKDKTLLKMVSFTNVRYEIINSVKELPVSENTITGRAIISGEPQFTLVGEYPENDFKKYLMEDEYFEFISYPIKTKSGIIGALTLGVKKSQSLIKDDNDFFSLICDQIGTIIDNISLYEKLDELAAKDPLTGISNRRNFDIIISHTFSRSLRYNIPFSIIMLDIDFFKNINDSFGHEAGDMVLVELVNLVKNQLRESDLLARYGGEEFIILLEECGVSSAYDTCERIREEVMNYPFDIKSQIIQVTISGGIAQYSPDDMSPDQVVSRADRALYRAKRSGRNRTVI